MSQRAFEDFKKTLEKYFYLPIIDLPIVDLPALSIVNSPLKDKVWFDDTKLCKLFDYYGLRENQKPSLDALVAPLVFCDLDTEAALLGMEYIHQAFGNHLQKSFDSAWEDFNIFSEHSEQQIEEQARETKVAVLKFPSDPDLCWEEVSMAFISDETIKVRARGHLREYKFDQIGFRDQKSGRPNTLWLALRGLALKDGRASWEDLREHTTQPFDIRDRNKLQAKVKGLRKILRNFMGIEDDPFHPYRKVKAYQTKFTLTADASALLDSDDTAAPSDWEETYLEEINHHS